MEIFNWQQRIAETLNEYLQKYNYVGQPGHEYDVIFSLFRELNTIKSPGNRHIFWYAVMPVLTESYRRYISQGQLPSLYPLRWGDQQQASTRLEKQTAPPVQAPSYLADLEGYIKPIVSLGIVRATCLPVPQEFCRFITNRIISQMKTLLQEMSMNLNFRIGEIPLVLTVKEATDNLVKLIPESDHCLNREFTKLRESEPYTETIINNYHELSSEEIDSHINMNDFWNGFIP